MSALRSPRKTTMYCRPSLPFSGTPLRMTADTGIAPFDASKTDPLTVTTAPGTRAA